MKQLIKTADSLQQYYENNKDNNLFDRALFITAEVRKEYICSIKQGLIELEDTEFRLHFEDAGGGVYLVRPRPQIQ